MNHSTSWVRSAVSEVSEASLTRTRAIDVIIVRDICRGLLWHALWETETERTQAECSVRYHCVDTCSLSGAIANIGVLS